MHFATMADVHAHYEQQARARHLRYQAHHLCNALCGKLDWSHAPEREAKIRRCLDRARVRLNRRERLNQYPVFLPRQLEETRGVEGGRDVLI